MNLYTIGFTRKSADRFFGLLRESQATTLIDVRLNNVSQLSGFAKRDDLQFFLRELCSMTYSHRVDLAPTQTMLDAYRKQGIGWAAYEEQFRGLIEARRIAETVPRELMADAVLLCSEEKPHHCHRRIVAEYLADRWSNVNIDHLV